MRNFHLQIVTPDGQIFDGDAEAILVRADRGDVEIMAGHADYFATLGTGRAKLTLDTGTREAATSGGFISVKSGEIKLVCTTFEFSDEIDLERAERAKEKAESAIKKATDDATLLLARAKLTRALCRINVAKNK